LNIIETCKKRFEQLKLNNSKIFENDAIQEISMNEVAGTSGSADDLIPIEMCHGAYSSDKFLYAENVFGSIVIASKGTKGTETIIGLYNFCGEDPKTILTNIKLDLEKQGCTDIEFSLIGGVLPYIDNNDTIDEWDGDFTECLKEQEEFLSLAKEFNIVSARFNLLNPQEPNNISILVTKNKVLYMI
jgi:hypothetical protein